MRKGAKEGKRKEVKEGGRGRERQGGRGRGSQEEGEPVKSVLPFFLPSVDVSFAFFLPSVDRTQMEVGG